MWNSRSPGLICPTSYPAAPHSQPSNLPQPSAPGCKHLLESPKSWPANQGGSQGLSLLPQIKKKKRSDFKPLLAISRNLCRASFGEAVPPCLFWVCCLPLSAEWPGVLLGSKVLPRTPQGAVAFPRPLFYLRSPPLCFCEKTHAPF